MTIFSEMIFMREWILENTTVTPEEYDRIAKYVNPPEKPSPVGKEYKKQILYALMMISLNKLTIFRRLKKAITKNGRWFNYKGTDFILFSDIYNDPRLLSLERYGKCARSHEIALEMKTDICTGICKDYKNHRFLHTFLLGIIDGEACVLDYTLNLVLKKDDYFNFMDVDVVSMIKNSNLVEYTINLLKNRNLGEVIDSHEFLCFPEQVNEAVLRLERAKKEE